MDTRRLLIILAALATFGSSLLLADEEIDKMLNQDQLALQAEIERNLVAPCCWNMTVDQHESGPSKQVRSQIANLIKTGKSKEQILNHFVAQPQYGERILATPSQETWLGKSAYWLIPFSIVFGAVIVMMTVKKLSNRETKRAAERDAKKNTALKRESGYADRVEQELEDF